MATQVGESNTILASYRRYVGCLPRGARASDLPVYDGLWPDFSHDYGPLGFEPKKIWWNW